MTDDGLRPRFRTEIAGIPLPYDLEPAIRWYAREEFWTLENTLIRPPWTHAPDGEDSEENYPGWKEADMPLEGWQTIHVTLRDCIRKGFFLALMRYADDLKHVPEAAALLEQKRKAAKKGGESRRKKAEPNHKAIRKRFRELRKTIPKKTVRYLRVAEEYGMSDRHVARIVDGID